MPYTADDRRRLYHLLVERFNLDELATLVLSELGLEPETFPQATRPAFCRALLLEREQHGQIRSLVQAILAHRPAPTLPSDDHQALVALLARLADEVPRDPDPDPFTTAAPTGVTLSAGTLSVSGDVVGGDKVTIIQTLTALPGLPTDYGTRIRNFLHLHLGDEHGRIPFGGRETELALLDAWLADDTEPPYALLTAEAGRGKSTLLVRWATLLEVWGEAHVVFVPISIRVDTARASVVFTALAARLAEVYGERIEWATLSADQWRGVCQSYLERTPPDGRPVVVILDGLDEAADWQAGADLFPRVPPAGVRVVVSARYLAGDPDEQGWRQRLGWEQARAARSIPLPLLTRAGVQAVLAAMGNPLDRLATKVDVVGELFRLSEGDPLLVRLYVESLGKQDEPMAFLQPAELQRLKPGLASYFERWERDQRHLWGRAAPLKERAVQTTLTLLAGARGPLDKETLLALAPPEAQLNAWELAEAIRPLERFIVGDGQTVGYAFSHPRLGYYFWEKLTQRERTEWERRFLAFGEQVLTDLTEGTLSPREAPAYAVQYYGAHLERAQAPDAAFYALIAEGWMRAWEALEGTHAGFLNDVARAWQRADQALAAGRNPGEALVQQIRAALCQSSIAALSANIPAALLALAVQHGIYTPAQALVLVAHAPTDSERGQRLIALAPFLPPPLLSQALDMAYAIRDTGWRAEVLTGVAPHVRGATQKQVVDDALIAAEAMQDSMGRAAILTTLAPYLSEPQQGFADALAAARAIPEEFHRTDVLTTLVPQLSGALQHQVLTEALNAARTIPYEGSRAEALLNLVPYLTSTLHDELVADALTIARAIPHQARRTEVLARVVSHLNGALQEQTLADALATARVIPDDEERSRVLLTLVPLLRGSAHHEALADTLTAARAVEDVWSRAATLAELVPLLDRGIQGEVLAEALDATSTIQDEGWRADVFLGLMPHLSDMIRPQGTAAALAAARAIRHEGWRVDTLRRLVPYLPSAVQPQILTEALSTTQTIQEDDSRADCLIGLAPLLSSEELLVALATARTIQNARWQAETLTALVPHLPSTLQTEVMADALNTIHATEDNRWRARALIELASLCNNTGRNDVLADALEVVRAIPDEGWRADTLTCLLQLLPQESVAVALEIATAIREEKWRIFALTGFLPHLNASLHAEVLADILASGRALSEEGDRANALLELLPHLSGSTKLEVIAEALTATYAIADGGWRAYNLIELLPHLTAPANLEVLADALTVALITEDERRNNSLIKLDPYLAAWVESDCAAALPYWTTTLRHLARRPRQNFLDDLAALHHFALALVGDEQTQAADGIFAAIQEVCRWWP